MRTELHNIWQEGNIIKVTLHAKSASLYKSLDQTALNYFATYAANKRLQYNSATVTGSERKDSDKAGMYYYTIIIQMNEEEPYKPLYSQWDDWGRGCVCDHAEKFHNEEGCLCYPCNCNKFQDEADEGPTN